MKTLALSASDERKTTLQDKAKAAREKAKEAAKRSPGTHDADERAKLKGEKIHQQ